ncbi:MAG TPA: LuxR C-terminal-related transcriptional regulator [Frankiaceae bacterium]|nr:LuxR C-terminal-related transcriptional regulator [Frankiaceae bacterium]
MSPRTAQVGFLHDALRASDAGAAESAALLLLSGGMPLVELYDEVLRTFFASLRADFESGILGLVDEHLASRAAAELVTLLGRRRMPWTADGVGGSGRGCVVLGAVPREQHLLGSRMLGQVLQSRGWAVLLLDALPFDALASYCSSLSERPAAIGLTLHSLSSTTSLRAGLTTLREGLPDVPVVLGGAALTEAPGLAAKVGAAAGAADLAAAVSAIELVTNPLTRRERQILGLVAGGASNAQIASELSVHSSTVKTHLEHVAGKLGTSDRTAAAVQGLRRGWID